MRYPLPSSPPYRSEFRYGIFVLHDLESMVNPIRNEWDILFKLCRVANRVSFVIRSQPIDMIVGRFVVSEIIASGIDPTDDHG